MRRFWIVMKIGPVLILVACSLLPSSAISFASTRTLTKTSGSYYLALGDSLTSAYGPGGKTNPNGMAKKFFITLQSHGVNSLLNLACAGETSKSFIKGPCPIPKQVQGRYGGYPFKSSQLMAALSFIHNHPGEVKYVTIDIGNNDIHPPDVSGGGCVFDGHGVPAILADFDTNFRSILSRLKTALGHSGVILAVNRYDPGATLCAHTPSWLKVYPAYNSHLLKDATAYGVLVADIYTAFGGRAAPNPKLCTLTHMCETPFDTHPTTKGHALIARVLKATAGL